MSKNPLPTWPARQRSAFTLIELLAAMAIILVLVALVVPVMTSMRDRTDLTQGAEEIAGLLEAARAHAVGANTYVWVGFYEHAPGTSGPHNDTPEYDGKGSVRIVAVASLDGTRIKKETLTGDNPLPAGTFRPLGRVRTLTGIHLTDIGAPTGGSPGTLGGRPSDPYAGSFTPQNRINSDSTEKTRFPFTVGDITFYKTIRFNPLGESNMNSSYSLRRFLEIGIVPARGDVVLAGEKNVAAVQVAGITGEVEIYRP